MGKALLFRLWGLILWLTRQQPNEWGQCPWCGYDDWEAFMYKAPWFEATNGGTYYVPGEPTVHWGKGFRLAQDAGINGSLRIVTDRRDNLWQL